LIKTPGAIEWSEVRLLDVFDRFDRVFSDSGFVSGSLPRFSLKLMPKHIRIIRMSRQRYWPANGSIDNTARTKAIGMMIHKETSGYHMYIKTTIITRFPSRNDLSNPIAIILYFCVIV